MTDTVPTVALPIITWANVEAALEALGLTDLYNDRRIMSVHLDPVNIIVSIDYSEADATPGAYADHFIPITGQPTEKAAIL